MSKNGKKKQQVCLYGSGFQKNTQNQVGARVSQRHLDLALKKKHEKHASAIDSGLQRLDHSLTKIAGRAKRTALSSGS